MDDERIRHIETEILALRMMIQTMLIFLTESKAGKAYDEALIRTMRDSLLRITRETEFGGSGDEPARRAQLERSLTDLLNPLAGSEA